LNKNRIVTAGIPIPPAPFSSGKGGCNHLGVLCSKYGTFRLDPDSWAVLKGESPYASIKNSLFVHSHLTVSLLSNGDEQSPPRMGRDPTNGGGGPSPPKLIPLSLLKSSFRF
jgi:hypothetical protein